VSEADLFMRYYLRYLPCPAYGARKSRLYTKIYLMRLAADLRLTSLNYREVVRHWRLQRVSHTGESE